MNIIQYISYKQAFLTGIAGLMSGMLLGHPGSLDINGGHYMGPSYHCHMSGCAMPDTFDLGRSRRDGAFTNYQNRERFFNRDDWSFEEDFDQDCQSTRQEMLILTSRTEIKYTNPRNCVVRTGEWLDEYTGKTFTVAVQIDIDHVIPLMYAHTHGGDRWMPDKKLAFANDPLNIMLVEKQEIRRKGDRGPNRYLPREEFQCEYAQLWNVLAEKYDLQLESRDRNKVRKILESCPDEVLNQSGLQ
ncbi:MAG: HNH endonuclease [Gammaproteobacteria bacterium]|nr:HNH endonuclease [Gammaproteobacteria bacterium]MCY4358093.1 HNH endonuclease [Gammaproteobacteria bacterium]